MRRIFVALFALASFATLANAQIMVKVDGKKVEFKYAQPQTVAGRTLVPLRGVFEAIGAYVEWNGEQRTITCRKENEEVQLRIGVRIARKNGSEIQIDVAPMVRRGTTLVPLRFIAESLGAKVEFDAGNNIVNITTDADGATLLAFRPLFL